MFVNDQTQFIRHRPAMLGKDEILGMLRADGVKQVEIARALGLPEGRITELYNGGRQLKL